MNSTESIEVILIHGTWGQNARWTHEESGFCWSLSEKLKRQVVFKRFSWSGRNGMFARAHAAAKLQSLLDEPSQVPRLLITHSHGGSIALQAIGSGKHKVAGIVCLNTPFVLTLGRDVRFASILAYELLAMTLIGTAAFHLQWTTWQVVFAVLFAWVLLGMLKPRLERWVFAKQAAMELRTTRRITAPVLCITSMEDEAFLILNGLEAVANLPALLTTRAVPTLLIPGVLVAGLLNLIPVLTAPWEVIGPRLADSLHGVTWVAATLVSTVIYATLIFGGALACSFLLSTVLRGFLFGVWLPSAHIFGRTTVSLVPLNATNLDFIELANLESSHMASTLHSLPYGDPRVLYLITTWFEEHLKESSDDRGVDEEAEYARKMREARLSWGEYY